jgi:hypothetical protein
MRPFRADRDDVETMRILLTSGDPVVMWEAAQRAEPEVVVAIARTAQNRIVRGPSAAAVREEDAARAIERYLLND